MAQSADDRLSGEQAETLDRLMARRILPRDRCVRSSL
jgi:hypothetical protein